MKKIRVFAETYPVVILNKRNRYQVMPLKNRILSEDRDAFLVIQDGNYGIAKLKDKTFIYVGVADWQPRN